MFWLYVFPMGRDIVVAVEEAGLPWLKPSKLQSKLNRLL